MVAWLSNLTSVLPLAADLVSKAVPAFNARKNDKTADAVPQQIAELQSAATDNAEAIKVLAAQLQQAVVAIQEGAKGSEERLLRLEETVRTTRSGHDDVQARLARIEASLGRAVALGGLGAASGLAALGLALYLWL